MIEQNVQVVRCQGERIWVRMGSQTGCTACDNGNGCAAGIFAKLLQRKPLVMELARNDMRVVPGQMVTLAFPEQVYMKLVMTTYAWPLLAALAGAFAGHELSVWFQFGPGLIDAGTLSVALLAGWAVMRLLNNRFNKDAVLNFLQTTVYYPSPTPDMCSNTMEQPKQI